MKRTLITIACLLMAPLAGPAAAQETERESLEAGVELFDFAYREPRLMRTEGIFYGVALAYTNHEPSFWKIEGRFSYGRADYTGALMDGTPLKISNINNYLFEVRGLKGLRRQDAPPSPVMPYIGLAYRRLADDSAARHPGGYFRESNYIYLPLGLDRRPDGQTVWSTGFTIEYDLFLWGKKISHLSDVDPRLSDAENKQTKGYGLRGSVRFLRKGVRNDIIIEPYFRYWNIKESNLDLVTLNGVPYMYVVEPDNEHRELGMRFLVRF